MGRRWLGLIFCFLMVFAPYAVGIFTLFGLGRFTFLFALGAALVHSTRMLFRAERLLIRAHGPVGVIAGIEVSWARAFIERGRSPEPLPTIRCF